MIAEPPFVGATQEIVTLTFVLTKVDGAAGVAGDVVIIAPLPAGEADELPNAFVATTVA